MVVPISEIIERKKSIEKLLENINARINEHNKNNHETPFRRFKTLDGYVAPYVLVDEQGNAYNEDILGYELFLRESESIDGLVVRKDGELMTFSAESTDQAEIIFRGYIYHQQPQEKSVLPYQEDDIESIRDNFEKEVKRDGYESANVSTLLNFGKVSTQSTINGHDKVFLLNQIGLDYGWD